MRQRTVVIGLAIIFCFLVWEQQRVSGSSPLTLPNNATHFVRLSPSAGHLIGRYQLQPLRTIDYGSFLWLELTEADWEQLRLADEAQNWAEESAGTIHLPNYIFDPRQQPLPTIPRHLQANPAQAGFRLIQLVGPTRDEWLQQLTANGWQILQYYPHYTYLVWTNNPNNSLDSLDFVRWSGLFHPAYKLSANLRQYPTAHDGRIHNLSVLFYNDGQLPQTLAAIQQFGGTIKQYHPAQPDRLFYQAIIALPPTAIEVIAQLSTVWWLDYSSPTPQLDDELSNQILAGNYQEGVPYVGYQDWLNEVGYTGNGVVWAVIDTGTDYDHPDLATQIVGGQTFPNTCDEAAEEPGSDCPNGGHGTHIAGIITGNASTDMTDEDGFLYGLGVAPQASIFSINSLSSPTWPPLGGWQENSKYAVLAGAIGGNNSWTTGEGTHHGYQTSERIHDLIVRDGNFDTDTIADPFIEVFSVGNADSAGITAPKEGKNLIVVASTDSYRLEGEGNIDQISDFSSWGPAEDGRWVPTISAPGNIILSTRNETGGLCASSVPNTDSLYAGCAGTSMSAAHVSGALALITEWWRTNHLSANPSPAMAKALLVNGAVDIGQPNIPNRYEGWGRVNLSNVITPSAPVLYYDQQQLLAGTGDQWQLIVTIADPNQPLKVTLAWTDAPGAVASNPALVNNLDLMVTTGPLTYHGNRFIGGWSVPWGSADSINNLENVFITNPADIATIYVTAANLAGDGVPYNGDPTDQDFALICSNCAVLFEVFPIAQSICAPSNAFYTIDIHQIPNYNGQVVLSVDNLPPAATAQFSNNPVTPPGNSQLQIGNTANIPSGSYHFNLIGTAGQTSHAETVELYLFHDPPPSPTLVLPPDQSRDNALQPHFDWTTVLAGEQYTLQIARDAQFQWIEHTIEDIEDTEYTLPWALVANTRYYWRVRAHNSCGQGNYSPMFNFVTLPMIGYCSIGTVPQMIFSDDFEQGGTSWTTAGTNNTWSLSSYAHSGNNSYAAIDLPFLSDQWLISPPIYLDPNQTPLALQFWNDQSIQLEDDECRDGARVEISMDAGNSWLPLSPEQLTDSYDGVVSDEYNNPLGGQRAWCGDSADWIEIMANLNEYAGTTAQFRFRLATDSFTGREGWYIDDVGIQGCVPAPYDADINPISQRNTAVNLTVTHTFSLTNLGPEDDYTLSLLPGQWATQILSPSPVRLLPYETGQLTVAVVVPNIPPAQLPVTDTFQLMVTSLQEPSLILTTTGSTQAVIPPDLIWTGETTQAGILGETISYSLTVSNIGNLADTLTIEMGAHNWNTVTPTPTITILPNEQVVIPIYVTIDAGTTDTVDLLLQSQIRQEPIAIIPLTTYTYPTHLPFLIKN